jgi:hypothetical protein
VRTINLTDQQSKKIAIAIAGIILAIAAIWYAWKISTFSSLSEPDARWWVHASEVLLIVSAILLAAGLFGEWPDSESWKKRLLYKAAKAAVIVGVLGELLGDGGIFAGGDRLQELEGRAIAGATAKAANANERAAQLEKEAAGARERAAQLEKETARLSAEAAQANARTACIEQAAAWRSLKPEEFNTLVSELSKSPPSRAVWIKYVSPDPEVVALAAQYVRAFIAARWLFRLDWVSFVDTVPFGVYIPNSGNDDTKAVQAAMHSAKLPFVPAEIPVAWGGGSVPNSTAPRSTVPDVTMLIGSKEPPFIFSSCDAKAGPK